MKIEKTYYLKVRVEDHRSADAEPIEVTIYKSRFQKSVIQLASTITGRAANLGAKTTRRKLFSGESLPCESDAPWQRRFVRVQTVERAA